MNVGDKVRYVGNNYNNYPSLKNKVGTIIEFWNGLVLCRFPTIPKFNSFTPCIKDELEIVSDE